MFEFVFEKNSTPRRLKLRVVDIFWQASSLKSLQKTLGYNEIVPIFYFLKIIFFYKGLQRKKWSRQNTAQSDTAQCFPARSRLCTVLSNFGFPQIFRKISMFLVDIHLKKNLTPLNVSLRGELNLTCLPGAQLGLIHEKKMPKISWHSHFKTIWSSSSP